MNKIKQKIKVLCFAALFASAFVNPTSLYAADYQFSAASNDSEKGSVSGTLNGTYPKNTTITLTATPAEGFTFTRWEGVPPARCLDNPLSLALTKDTTVTAVFGKTYYVATSGNDSTTDGMNPDTPFLTIEKALDKAGDDDTVSVREGTFAGTSDITITKAVTLRGVGMDKTIRTGKKITFENANAIVADMRISNRDGNNGGVAFSSGKGGGTLLRCDVSGHYKTQTWGGGIRVNVGNIIDSIVTNNWCTQDNGSGVGIFVNGGSTLGGPILIEGTLVADNRIPGKGECAGVAIEGSYSGDIVIRNTTIAANKGGAICAGLYAPKGGYNLLVENCFIGGNMKRGAHTPEQTDDAYLGTPNNDAHKRIFHNTVIAKMPAYTDNGSFGFENCITNTAHGLVDLLHPDWRITSKSPAWGLAGDGKDAGYFQTENNGDFDVGCYASKDLCFDTDKVILRAMVKNAPSQDVTFTWDLDGDGEIDATGREIEHNKKTLGFNTVAVTAAVSDSQPVAKTFDNLFGVIRKEIFVWTGSPSSQFPYATWETAAHTPHDALNVAIAGSKVQLTNEFIKVSSSMEITRKIEFCGTGKDNNSTSASSYTETKAQEDKNATGTSISGDTSNVVAPLIIHDSGALIHSLALGVAWNNVVKMFSDSIISNCVVRNGSYTGAGGNGRGIYALAGLITHSIISNNYSSAGYSGGEVYLSGATLRNCLVTGGRHTKTTNPGTMGAVYAENGATVENCTIVGNTAGNCAGLYTSGKASVFNNIIYDNTPSVEGTSLGAPNWHVATVGSAVWSNNCTTVAFADGDGTVLDPPKFKSGTGLKSFTLEASSPCINKGILLPWMTAAATDLLGNPRCANNKVDIGACERAISGLSIIIR